MGSFIDDFLQSKGTEITAQISDKLGIDSEKVSGMLPNIVPMILGGLKKEKDNKGGAERVDHILNKHGNKEDAENIGGVVQSVKQKDNTDPGLGGLLGDSGFKAADFLGEKFGLSKELTSQIIPMVAPIVLGFLKKKRDDDGLGTSGIASIIDRDGDGSILDDIGGFLSKGLGNSDLGKSLGGLFK